VLLLTLVYGQEQMRTSLANPLVLSTRAISWHDSTAPLLSSIIWLRQFAPNEISIHQFHTLVDHTALSLPTLSLEKTNSYLQLQANKGQLPPAISFLTENWISLCSHRQTSHISIRNFREISLKIWKLHLSGSEQKQVLSQRQGCSKSPEQDSWTLWLQIFVQIFSDRKKLSESVLLDSMERDLLWLLMELMRSNFTARENQEKGNKALCLSLC
jgi:hypothetical protein